MDKGNHIPCNVKRIIVTTQFLNDTEVKIIYSLLVFSGRNKVCPKRDGNIITFDVDVGTENVERNAYEDLEEEIRLKLESFGKQKNYEYKLIYKEA